jgi:hypothetical protein
MRILASASLWLHFILLDHYSVKAQLLDGLENGSYDLFALDGFEDQATLSQLPPVDISESYSPVFSDMDLTSDFPIVDCSSESSQHELINKRLAPDSEDPPQSCPPRSEIQPSSHDDSPSLESFPDPLVKVQRFDADDEEFCASRSGLPTFFICDSGQMSERERNQLTWKYQLNNCQRSRYPFYNPFLLLRLHLDGGLSTS